jgi:hypothetical protein
VALSGQPLGGAEVVVQGDRVKVDPNLPDDEDEMFDENKRPNVSDLAGRKQQLSVDAKGEIRIDGLAPGTYRLTLGGGGAARRELRGIAVKQGETTELGLVQMDVGSTIHGRIVLGPGLSPAGLELQLDDDYFRTTKVTAPDGSFSFQGIEAGQHTVNLRPAPPMVIEYESREVTVTPGSSPEVVFDLAASAPCAVELTIFRGGKPASGVSVRWFARKDGNEIGGRELGKSDDQGLVRGTCPGGANVRFELRSPAGLQVGSSQAPVSLVAGGSHSERIELKVGTIELVLPSVLEIPEVGCVEAMLSPKGKDDGRIELAQCHTPRSPFHMTGTVTWQGHRVELGDVGIGEYHATVRTYRSEKRSTPGNDPETESWESVELGSPFEADIIVEDGMPTILQLP